MVQPQCNLDDVILHAKAHRKQIQRDNSKSNTGNALHHAPEFLVTTGNQNLPRCQGLGRVPKVHDSLHEYWEHPKPSDG